MIAFLAAILAVVLIFGNGPIAPSSELKVGDCVKIHTGNVAFDRDIWSIRTFDNQYYYLDSSDYKASMVMPKDGPITKTECK